MNQVSREASAGMARRAVSLTINGRTYDVVSPAAERLANVLRDELGLTGTKIGCNAGDCGACTILLDGRQVCSCLVSLGQAEGHSITTVEGLQSDARYQALQTAFVRAGAVQCGICTPGMLMAAAELASEQVIPGRDKILDRMGGVLCRCTGYTKIIDAIEHFLAGSVDSLIPLDAPNTVGARLPRIDGLDRVTGEARYGADATPSDALYLRLVRSPHPHARFQIGDLAEFVRENPGVYCVLTAQDIPGRNGFGIFEHYRDQPVLADGYVRFLGEAIAAIVGERHAIRGLDLTNFPVVWDVLTPISGISTALDPAAKLLHRDRSGNVLTNGRQITGNVECERGEHVARGTFETSYVEHAYIEPEAGFARRVGNRIEVFVTTQTPYMDRDGVAHVLGIPPEAVRIVPSAVGGGFGGKIDMSVQPLVAVAAWITGRPVACVYSRLESMRVTPKRHPAKIGATMTCDASGRLKSYEFHADFNTGPYASAGPIVANRVPIHAMGPYRIPAVRCTTRAVHTTDAIGGAFRGFGVPQAAIAHEALMDELADQVRIDRLEFRLLNALAPGDATATGQVLKHSVGMRDCIEALRPAWIAERQANETFNRAQDRIRRGIGIGCMWYGIGNTSQPNPSSMRIGLDRSGRITLYSGAVDIGQGVNTVMVQMCADALGVPPSRIKLVLGDTDRTLDAGKSSASRQTFISGNAVVQAAEKLKAAILRHTNASPSSQIVFAEDGVRVIDRDRELELSLTTMPEDVEGNVLVETGYYDPPTTDLDDHGQGVPYATYAFAAQLASVEVDTLLATVKVRKIWAAHDVGRAINPTQVEGQIQGGIVQGLGLALMEEYIPGLTDDLHNYLIPTFGDVPEIEIHLIESREPLGPFGAKGIGEPALIPTAPAILNAITDAVGCRPTKVPVTPSRLWDLLRNRPAG
jgi:CO/xanthine dehydrogenase Mo-binding subunit/aerobic-type carbon monoxide dehydrogenase small subunit (CoxS/CutS family)